MKFEYDHFDVYSVRQGNLTLEPDLLRIEGKTVVVNEETLQRLRGETPPPTLSVSLVYNKLYGPQQKPDRDKHVQRVGSQFLPFTKMADREVIHHYPKGEIRFSGIQLTDINRLSRTLAFLETDLKTLRGTAI